MKMIKALLFCVVALVSEAVLASVTQNQLLINQMSKTPYTIIDVRSEAEFKAGHIKGAIHIPHNELDKHMHKLEALKDTDLVIYCRSGRRASIVQTLLKQKGIASSHLEGDYLLWVENKLPIISFE